MELLEVICNAHFTDTRIGAVSRKQVMRIPAAVAQDLASLNLVTIRDPMPTVLPAGPQIVPEVDGGAEPFVSLQVDQVSVSETRKPSRKGKPRRDG
jgi:hypothetical protein